MGERFSPVDSNGVYIDIITSKAYLHHLFKAGELLAMQIASIIILLLPSISY